MFGYTENDSDPAHGDQYKVLQQSAGVAGDVSTFYCFKAGNYGDVSKRSGGEADAGGDVRTAQ